MVTATTIGISVGIAGIVISALAAIMGFAVAPIIVENIIKEQTKLVKGSEVYEKWVDIPVPIYFRLYMFNLTNADEIRRNWSAIPELKEVGPYVYREKRTKDNIQRNSADGTITFKPRTVFEFDREASIGSEFDDITIINAALFSLSYLMVSKITLMPESATHLVHRLITDYNETMALTCKIREFVFDGVPLPHYENIENLVKLLGLKLPDEINGGKFAIYLGKNDQYYDGVWEVYTGEKDIGKVNTLKRINGNKRSPMWRDDISPYCGVLNGSDGTTHPPLMKKDDRIYAYATELCRALYVEYKEEINFEGIPGWRYGLDDKILKSKNNNPDNECFCPPQGFFSSPCNVDGVIPLNLCRSEIPVVLSKPHFLDGDESLRQNVRGMNPDREKHELFIDVEPNLGVTIRGRNRIQISMHIQPLNLTQQFRELPERFVPLFWVDQDASLDDELIDELKSRVVLPLQLVNIGKWVGTGLGIVLSMIGIFVYIKYK